MAKLRTENLPVSLICDLFSYDPESGVVTRISTGTTGSKNTDGRIIFKVLGRVYLAHRIAFAISNKRWPISEIDHKNGNPIDNRLLNLREASRCENMRNRGVAKNNTSGFTGVHWSENEKRWKSYIKVNGVRIHIGTFVNLEDAIRERISAENRFFGDFSPKNSRR